MATRTLLEIVQAFCGERGLKVPTSVIGNTDKQVVQFKGLLEKLNRDLITRKAFQQNTIEDTHTTLAQVDQGDIDAIAEKGFEGFRFQSVFNRTTRQPLFGGIESAEWQFRQTLNLSGPLYTFRLRGNRLLMNPAPPAGQTIAFEYFSSWFIKTVTTGDPKKFYTADTDYHALGDDIPLAWLTWAWAQAKGFEYAEDFRAYERLVARKLARDNAPPVVNLATNRSQATPGIVVPPGSWSVP